MAQIAIQKAARFLYSEQPDFTNIEQPDRADDQNINS
jgi:hypothetical protein